MLGFDKHRYLTAKYEFISHSFLLFFPPSAASFLITAIENSVFLQVSHLKPTMFRISGHKFPVFGNYDSFCKFGSFKRFHKQLGYSHVFQFSQIEINVTRSRCCLQHFTCTLNKHIKYGTRLKHLL